MVLEQPAEAQGVLAGGAETQLILNASLGARYTHRAAFYESLSQVRVQGKASKELSLRQAFKETRGDLCHSGQLRLLQSFWPLTGHEPIPTTRFKEQPFPGTLGYW